MDAKLAAMMEKRRKAAEEAEEAVVVVAQHADNEHEVHDELHPDDRDVHPGFLMPDHVVTQIHGAQIQTHKAQIPNFAAPARGETKEEQESGAAVCATRRGKPPRRMRGYEQPTICSAAAPLCERRRPRRYLMPGAPGSTTLLWLPRTATPAAAAPSLRRRRAMRSASSLSCFRETEWARRSRMSP